jgi:hypothetical protein
MGRSPIQGVLLKCFNLFVVSELAPGRNRPQDLNGEMRNNILTEVNNITKDIMRDVTTALQEMPGNRMSKLQSVEDMRNVRQNSEWGAVHTLVT